MGRRNFIRKAPIAETPAVLIPFEILIMVIAEKRQFVRLVFEGDRQACGINAIDQEIRCRIVLAYIPVLEITVDYLIHGQPDVGGRRIWQAGIVCDAKR